MHCWASISWQGCQGEISDGCSSLHGRVQAAAYFSSLTSSSSPSWDRVMGSVHVLVVEQLNHLEMQSYPELSRPEVASYSHKTLNHFHVLGTDVCHCTGSCATHCLVTEGARTLLEPGTALIPGQTDSSPTEIHSSLTACLSAQGLLFPWPCCLLS